MAQQTAAGTVQLPPDVVALAVHREMGPHLRTYLPKRPGVGMLVLFALCTGIPLAIAILLAVGGAWSPAVFCLLLAGLFAALALRFPTFNRALAARRVYLFQHGFIHTGKGGRLADYRWDAIAWVTQQITDRYVNGIHIGTFHIYTVARKDGPVVKLTVFYDGIAELGQQISREVTRVKLPGALALVQQGRTVGFGDLGIHAQGLVSSKGSVLPWRDLEAVQVVQGYVKLRQAGKWLAWSNKPAAQIPNLFVFLTLADQLQRAAHAR